MTPHERVFAAIRGEPVDRLPVCTYNCHPFSWGRHAAWAEYAPILEAVERCGAAVLCKVPVGRTGGLLAPADVVQLAEGGERVTTSVLETPAGPLRKVVRKPADQPAYCVEHYVKDDEDIRRLLSLEPRPVQWKVDELLDRCEEIGQAGVAYVSYEDPFGAVVSLFDQDDFLIRMHTDPGPIMELIEWAFQQSRLELSALLDGLGQARPEVLFYTCGPELATPPLLPPEVFARVITPYQSQLVAMIHDHGFPVSMHCHGRVRDVLEEVLRCGFDVLEPIEPPPQGNIDLAELRQRVGDRLCLMGYMQDQDFYSAEPEDIRRHVAGIVEVVGRGSRFIASPTCTPFQFPPTPRYVQNYVTFLEASAELGA